MDSSACCVLFWLTLNNDFLGDCLAAFHLTLTNNFLALFAARQLFAAKGQGNREGGHIVGNPKSALMPMKCELCFARQLFAKQGRAKQGLEMNCEVERALALRLLRSFTIGYKLCLGLTMCGRLPATD